MMSIDELLRFLACHGDLPSVADYHVISTVDCNDTFRQTHEMDKMNAPLGSKMGLCFPIRTNAIRSASFPRIRSEAST